MQSLCDKFVQQISNCLVYVPHGELPVEWQVAVASGSGNGNWQSIVFLACGGMFAACCMLHAASGKPNKNAFHARNMTWLNLFYFGAFNDFAQTTTMPQPQPETPLQLAGADSAHTHTHLYTHVHRHKASVIVLGHNELNLRQ